MLGTGFAFVTTTLTNVRARAPRRPLRLAFAATIVATFVYTAGLICSFFLPEPKGDDFRNKRRVQCVRTVLFSRAAGCWLASSSLP